MTLHRRWFDVAIIIASRRIDIDAMLYKCHDVASTLMQHFTN